MTHKDYANIAHTIARHYRDASPTAKLTIRNLVGDICHDFKLENRNFDRATFLTACGIES